MTSKNSKSRFKNGRAKQGLKFVFKPSHEEFFQNTSAEREENLANYYVDNPYFQSAVDSKSKKAFFVGRTGIGKTAILESVRRQTSFQQNIISIDPEDFAFKIMEGSEVLRQLTSHQINLDLFYKTMWKYIFVTEILKEIYGNRKKNWLEQQMLKWNSDSNAIRAYKFLLDNDELDAGLSFNKKIERIVNKLEKTIIEAKIDLKPLTIGYKKSTDTNKKIHNALQKFEFNDININYFIKHLDKFILNNRNFVIIVDDLDKNWIQNKIGINFTRCLFETMFEINNSKHLRLLVSLRTNLFDQLQFNQREKYTPYINHVFWNDNQIKEIVEKRFKEIDITNGSDIWKHIFPDNIPVDNKKSFETFQYLLSRSNMRPRDILLFISYAIGNSIGKNHITKDTILKSEESYSKDRLNALKDEWNNPYLDIGKIFNYFRRCPHKLQKDEFNAIIDNISVAALEKEEAKKLDNWSWMIEGSYVNKDSYNSEKLKQLLYKIGFIGVKEAPSSSIQYIHKDLNNIPDFDSKDIKFYINPCYYRAINVTFY